MKQAVRSSRLMQMVMLKRAIMPKAETGCCRAEKSVKQATVR
jgi:hypothetical protein